MLSSYSLDGAKVDKIMAQVDVIVFRLKGAIELSSKEGIRAQSVNERLEAVSVEHIRIYRSEKREKVKKLCNLCLLSATDPNWGHVLFYLIFWQIKNY